MITLEDDIAQSRARALMIGAFLDKLSSPTPAQLWLERVGAQLEEERRQTGNLKGGEK